MVKINKTSFVTTMQTIRCLEKRLDVYLPHILELTNEKHPAVLAYNANNVISLIHQDEPLEDSKMLSRFKSLDPEVFLQVYRGESHLGIKPDKVIEKLSLLAEKDIIDTNATMKICQILKPVLTKKSIFQEQQPITSQASSQDNNPNQSL